MNCSGHKKLGKLASEEYASSPKRLLCNTTGGGKGRSNTNKGLGIYTSAKGPTTIIGGEGVEGAGVGFTKWLMHKQSSDSTLPASMLSKVALQACLTSVAGEMQGSRAANALVEAQRKVDPQPDHPPVRSLTAQVEANGSRSAQDGVWKLQKEGTKENNGCLNMGVSHLVASCFWAPPQKNRNQQQNKCAFLVVFL